MEEGVRRVKVRRKRAESLSLRELEDMVGWI